MLFNKLGVLPSFGLIETLDGLNVQTTGVSSQHKNIRDGKMRHLRALFIACSLSLAGYTAASLVEPVTTPAEASQIKYVVNGMPVTSYDIERRKAFLRLQRKRGNLTQKATDEMIDQALRMAEMKRLKINISDEQVNAAFANFAKGNRMSTKQMSGILNQTGITTKHFKEFVRAQLGWNQALGARYRATGQLSEQDAVQRMLQQGGEKPTATEYFLQQVIFVVPQNQRKSLMGKRRKEANALRQRFKECKSTKEFAKGLLDVTVRDLGRVLGPELPPEWADYIKKTSAGSATPVRETQRGVEFIGVCSTREVSDDRVAQMVFSNEGTISEKANELSDKYMKELKEKARIQKR